MSHASASWVRVREIPALYHMVDRREERTSVRSSCAWVLGWMEEMTVEGVGGVPLRSAACCPAIAPMTSPSRSESVGAVESGAGGFADRVEVGDIGRAGE